MKYSITELTCRCLVGSTDNKINIPAGQDWILQAAYVLPDKDYVPPSPNRPVQDYGDIEFIYNDKSYHRMNVLALMDAWWSRVHLEPLTQVQALHNQLVTLGNRIRIGEAQPEELKSWSYVWYEYLRSLHASFAKPLQMAAGHVFWMERRTSPAPGEHMSSGVQIYTPLEVELWILVRRSVI